MKHRFAPGTVVLEKLRVVRKLGEGGMGVVYEVDHLGTGHLRALKVMHAQYVTSQDMVERFLREARIASRIRSDAVADIIDSGRLPDGRPYVLMERLHGVSFADLVTVTAPLPLEVAAHFARLICAALSDVHAAGLLHRDLKPENLFVVRGAHGHVAIKVLDFGVAHILDNDGAARLTADGFAIGTLPYMSPEQLRGRRDVDARIDLFALGVVLFESLTACWPYEGGTSAELAHAVLGGNRTEITELRDDLPTRFIEVLDAALATERDDRPASAAELAELLAPFDKGPVAYDAIVRADGTVRASLHNAIRSARGESSRSVVVVPRTPSSMRAPRLAAAKAASASKAAEASKAADAAEPERSTARPKKRSPRPGDVAAQADVAAAAGEIGAGAAQNDAQRGPRAAAAAPNDAPSDLRAVPAAQSEAQSDPRAVPSAQNDAQSDLRAVPSAQNDAQSDLRAVPPAPSDAGGAPRAVPHVSEPPRASDRPRTPSVVVSAPTPTPKPLSANDAAAAPMASPALPAPPAPPRLAAPSPEETLRTRSVSPPSTFSRQWAAVAIGLVLGLGTAGGLLAAYVAGRSDARPVMVAATPTVQSVPSAPVTAPSVEEAPAVPPTAPPPSAAETTSALPRVRVPGRDRLPSIERRNPYATSARRTP